MNLAEVCNLLCRRGPNPVHVVFIFSKGYHFTSDLHWLQNAIEGKRGRCIGFLLGHYRDHRSSSYGTEKRDSHHPTQPNPSGSGCPPTCEAEDAQSQGWGLGFHTCYSLDLMSPEVPHIRGGRFLGHWGYALGGNCGTLVSLFLSFPLSSHKVSSLAPHTLLLSCATSPRAPKQQGQRVLDCEPK